MKKYIKIAGTGSSVPDKILTNADMEKIVDTGDVWISERISAKERQHSLHGKCGAEYALEATARRINLPIDRVSEHIHNYGNTSSAPIPLALDEAVSEGRMISGDDVVLVGFGADFTWGSALIEW